MINNTSFSIKSQVFYTYRLYFLIHILQLSYISDKAVTSTMLVTAYICCIYYYFI